MKNIQYYFCLYSVIIILLFSLPLYSQTEAAPPPNIDDPDVGQESNPYQITNFANLKWLSDQEWNEETDNNFYIQTADIDASETADWENGLGFMPIGRYEFPYYGFIGSYNGNHHTISNLYVYDPSTRFIGLFGDIKNSHIFDLSLENVTINIFSLNTGFGSLVAHAFNSQITNCFVSGNVFSIGAPFGITGGGLVGAALYSEINNSHALVDFDFNQIYPFGNNWIGGLVGYLGASTLRNSFYIGNALMPNYTGNSPTCFGGIAEWVAWREYILPFYLGSTVENVYSVATVEGAEIVSGFATLIEDSSFINSFWNMEVSEFDGDFYLIEGENIISNNYGLTTEQMKQATPYIENGWDFENIWGIDPEINNGYPYLLNSSLVSTKDIHIISNHNILRGNYPNPFNPSTTISYHLNMPRSVNISVYNIKGQLIKVLVNEGMEAGNNSVVWNGDDTSGKSVSSGIYFYKMETEFGIDIKKMLLLK